MFPIIGDVVIRTNGGRLTVNAPLDTVYHYNSANVVAISSIADHSFHEFGKIDGEISIKEGHLILESGSYAMFVNVNVSTEAELAKVSVSLESGSSYSYVTAANNELISQVLAVVENKTGEETIKTLVKIDESAVAFIKDGDNVIEYSDIILALNAFKTMEGATLELLDNIVNIEAEKKISITIPKNGTINGNDKMIYGNVAIHVNPAGGSIYNIQFKYIHNNSQASQDECDWYGWISKEGKLTAIYASGLEGKLVIDGCLFDNIDWDAIQTTPTSGATIEITNNVFMHSDKTAYSQLRYIHIERYKAVYTLATVVITGNEFYKTKNTFASAITNIGCYYVKLSENSDFTGNYFEYEGNVIDTNSAISDISLLIPLLATSQSIEGDLAPACYDIDTLYVTLQEAINSGKTNIKLAKNNNESVTIAEGKTVTINRNGYQLNGMITNNGTLTFSGSTFGGNATINNNGSITLSCNAAAGYTVTGNGTVSITNSATYDLSKISGNITISGGTFNAQPQSDWLAEWYVSTQNEDDGSFIVRLMNDEEAIAVGAVARYKSETNNLRKYFKTLQEGVHKEAVYVYLLGNLSESITKDNGDISFYGEDFTFTGSLSSSANVNIYNGTAVLDSVNGVKLTFGNKNNYKGLNVTMKDGNITGDIIINKNYTDGTIIVIEGGTYAGTITVMTGASLNIKGGTFSFDPTAYVDTETHIVTNNQDNTWTVSVK